MDEPTSNWAGNIIYGARAAHAPGSVEELQEIVRRGGKLRALGSRHSFNRLADSDRALVSMRGLSRVLGIDRAAQQVTVEGGITYGQLCPVLDAAGFGLPNLASLPHISVVGACATATHGSGVGNRNLAAAVAALEVVTGTGEIVTLKRGDADFPGAVVGLGAAGLVARATLDLVPRFEVRQNVYLDLPYEALVENFEAIMGSAYSVSLFTHWAGDSIAQVWLKRLADAPPAPADFFGARAAERPYHPLISMDPAPATEQLGVAGPWYQRLPHFRMEFTPSAGAELQSEYFVARADAVAAIEALRAIGERIAPHLFVSELRTIAADELWMSPNYRQDSLAFHFTWKPDWPAVAQVLPLVEAQLRPFGVKPHWGKLFTLPKAEVQARYERLPAFRAVLQRLDPGGKFRNAFVDEFIF